MRKKIYHHQAAGLLMLVSAHECMFVAHASWKDGGCHKKAAGRIKFLFELYVFYL